MKYSNHKLKKEATTQLVVESLHRNHERNNAAISLLDNRPKLAIQRKLMEALATKNESAIQRKTYSGKFSDNLNPGIRGLEDNRPKSAIQRKTQELLNGKKGENTIQKKTNGTGLPDNLKLGVENLSGQSMDDVRVYYNSDKPAQLNAHAYAQGSDIHVAPGQEKHLHHEAWHVVQQKQGRVKPTMQLKEKVNINDEESLEKEADVMGSKALQFKRNEKEASYANDQKIHLNQNTRKNEPIIQQMSDIIQRFGNKSFVDLAEFQKAFHGVRLNKKEGGGKQ